MCRVLLIAASRGAHEVLTMGRPAFLSYCRLEDPPRAAGRSRTPSDAFLRRSPRTLLVSSGPATRRARPNARRRSAASRHPSSGCSHAPLPGRRRRRSGTTNPFTATTRSNSVIRSRTRQPMHIRTGPPGSVGVDVASVAAGIEERADMGVYRLADRVGNTKPASGRTGPVLLRRGRFRSSRPDRPRRAARTASARHCGCRYASRSAGRRAGRSAPPCRWPGITGSRAPPPERPGPPDQRR